MATLYKRKGSACWYGKFQENGKTHRFSTSKRKRCEAEEVLSDKVAEVQGTGEVDKLTKRLQEALDGLPREQQDSKRQEITQALLRLQHQKLSLKETWERWIASPRKGNPGPNTRAGYKAIWHRCRRWTEENRSELEYLHEIDPLTAEAYAADLWGSGITPRTYNAHVTFLTGLFNALSNSAGLQSNIWQPLPRMEGQTESRRELTPEEIQKLVGQADGNLRVMLLVGLYTGMRLGDVCLFKWRSIDFKRNCIEYVPLKTKRKNKTVVVPIHSVLGEALRTFKSSSEDEYVFPSEAALYQRDRQGVAKWLKLHFEGCGIETTEHSFQGNRKKAIARVGFHSLRHSFVSLCAAGGVPQVALMEMVGHGSPAMTRLYSHAGHEQKVSAINALPQFIEEGREEIS